MNFVKDVRGIIEFFDTLITNLKNKLYSWVFLNLNTITHLTLNQNFNGNFKNMPSSVTHLSIPIISIQIEDIKYLSSAICLKMPNEAFIALDNFSDLVECLKIFHI